MNPRPLQPQPQFPFPQEFLMLFLGLFCTFLLVWLVAYIFYLLTLQKALSRVSPRNRLMEPGQVWLMFVPCLNIVWGFLIAIRIPDSLKKEFQDRGRDDGSDYGKAIGLTYCILNLVGGVIGNGVGRVQEMEIVGSVISGIVLVITFTLLIVFWVKIANYSKLLEADETNRYREFDRRFGDDDDRDRDDDRRYDERDSPKPLGGPAAEGIKEGEPEPSPRPLGGPAEEGIKEGDPAQHKPPA